MSFIRERLRVILVATDDARVESCYAVELRNLGCTVRSVATVAGAVAIAERVEPDLVIVDLFLPGGGWELVCRLKAGEYTRQIPILVLAGEGADIVGVVPKPLDGVVILRRPCAPEAFERQVADALELSVDVDGPALRSLG